MTKHSPGPWERNGNSDVYIETGVDDWDYVVWTPDEHYANREADARLIAAAPSMLALLQELIDIEGPQPGTAAWADRVRAIISKATGEA